jgi:hypothetical protein
VAGRQTHPERRLGFRAGSEEEGDDAGGDRDEQHADDEVHASFFERTLPADAFAFDNALRSTDVEHEWQPRAPTTGPERA